MIGCRLPVSSRGLSVSGRGSPATGQWPLAPGCRGYVDHHLGRGWGCPGDVGRRHPHEV